MEKPALLISRCLLGEPVRFDGAGKPLPTAALASLAERYRLVPVCPEQLGGLPTPRPPAELQGGDGHAALAGRARVCTADGLDQSEAFLAGAARAVAIAETQQAQRALLKADSPSCGHRHIHDGQFRGVRIAGRGVAAASLADAGLSLYDEQQWQTLLVDQSNL